MQTPFFIELGFTLPEIAGVKKAVGFATLTLGGVLGGVLVAGWGIMRSLLLCGFLQALTNLVFVYQAWAGHDLFALDNGRVREHRDRYGGHRLCRLSLQSL